MGQAQTRPCQKPNRKLWIRMVQNPMKQIKRGVLLPKSAKTETIKLETEPKIKLVLYTNIMINSYIIS